MSVHKVLEDGGNGPSKAGSVMVSDTVTENGSCPYADRPGG